MGGRLISVSETSHSRVGRAYTSAIINARNRPPTGPVATPQTAWASDWWQALLQTPLARSEHYNKPAKKATIFPDGYWDMEKQEGGVGVSGLDTQGA